MGEPSQNNEKLRKRAKRKFLNVPLIQHLADLHSPMRDRYLLTLGCSSKIKTLEGKIISRYCKRSWCNVCNPIRTAVRINNYREQLESLSDLHLTTLTCPNVDHSQIKTSIDNFRSIFRQFRNTYKKKTTHVFKGVYNFEVTYNHRTKLYHPHIHIIHEGLPVTNITAQVFDKSTGRFTPEIKCTNALIDYWCNHNATVSVLAQDTRPCTNLIEGFKYQALSIFKIKINGKKQPFIPVVELDLIYQQLHAVRCFQPFGIRKIEKDEDQQMDELTAYNTEKPDGIYFWQRYDWHHHQQHTPLTDFEPNKNVITLYEKIKSNQYYRRNENSIPNAKGVRDLPANKKQEVNQATIRGLLNQCWKNSQIAPTK